MGIKNFYQVITATKPRHLPLRFIFPFSADSAISSGKSLDLSNGVFAEVSTGGTEDTFDGGSNFSVSMWVKGWPGSADQSLVSKNDFSPDSMGNLMLWLDAEKAEYLSTDGTVSPPSSGDAISKWYDRSGKGYHAVPDGSNPVWNATLINSKPGVNLDNTRMKIENSEVDFDAWSKLHVFAVFEVYNGWHTWKRYFGKTTDINSQSATAWHFGARRGDYNPPLLRSWVVNSTPTTSSIEGQGATSTASFKGSPGLFSMSYGDGSFIRRIDGTQWGSTKSLSGNLQSLNTTPVYIGHNFEVKISEFIIFNDKLSSADEQKLEGYLAHKWDLDGDLPTGHSHKASAPTFGGWAIGRAASGNDAIALNMENAGGEFSTNVPINDNEWHHLTTTYGSGNKKIYVDGVEVSTASQSGTVAASTFKLILGDPDPHAGGSSRPKIDDVRFYRGVLTAAEVSAIYNDGSGDIGEPKLQITSPATIKGSVGKNISYQILTDTAYGITGYNSSISYELLNVPSGLSLNIASGTITGTPSTAGTYNFQVKASNDSNWSAVKDIALTVNDYSAWNYGLSFTTDYSENSPLEDWNMLVRFSDDSSTGMGASGFRYAQARSNGSDLRFIDKHGAELKYEIANWNTVGESQVWVRVPSLKSDSNITAYWGNSNAGLPGYANDGSVWDGYFGVYHLEGSTGSAKDSSAWGHDLPGVNSPTVVSSGMSGTSYSTTASANNGFIGTLSSSVKSKEGTYTIWANTPGNPTDWKDFFGLEYNGDAGHYTRLEANNASPAKANMFVNGGSSGFSGITNPNDALGGWQMLSLVIKDGYASIYVDGTLDGTSGWYHPGLDTISKIAIGRGTADSGADFSFDEATFSTTGRSADWLLASYNNQKPDQGSNPYLNFESLSGPISLNDEPYTKIYGKKGTAITSYTVGHSGSGSFSASGLNGTGLTLNSATGILSGTPILAGTSNITVTATGLSPSWNASYRLQTRLHHRNQRSIFFPISYGPNIIRIYWILYADRLPRAGRVQLIHKRIFLQWVFRRRWRWSAYRWRSSFLCIKWKRTSLRNY